MAVGCRRQTNNAVRTTAVTNMLEADGISERDIAGVTGHLALASISHYDRTKMKKRYEIADAIMRIPERNVASTETTASQVESHQVIENLLKDQENTVIVTSKFSL